MDDAKQQCMGVSSKVWKAIFLFLLALAVCVFVFWYVSVRFSFLFGGSTTTVLPPVVVSTTVARSLSEYFVKSPDEVVSDIQRVREIVVSGNHSACASVDPVNMPLARDMCYYSIAVNDRSEVECQPIADEKVRGICVERVSYLSATDNPVEKKSGVNDTKVPS